MKQQRIDACLKFCGALKQKVMISFLPRIDTANETWVHYNRRKSKESLLTEPLKFLTQSYADKVILTLFLDERGVIIYHYMTRWNNATSAACKYLFRNHCRPAIKSKRRGRLSENFLLQHGNAQSHTAHATAVTIEELHFQCLPYPLYSPDLASRDFHLFGRLT